MQLKLKVKSKNRKWFNSVVNFYVFQRDYILISFFFVQCTVRERKPPIIHMLLLYNRLLLLSYWRTLDVNSAQFEVFEVRDDDDQIVQREEGAVACLKDPSVSGLRLP